MKKFLPFLLLLACAFTCFSCSEEDDLKPQPVTITYNGYSTVTKEGSFTVNAENVKTENIKSIGIELYQIASDGYKENLVYRDAKEFTGNKTATFYYPISRMFTHYNAYGICNLKDGKQIKSIKVFVNQH